jgi:hypothetical protein
MDDLKGETLVLRRLKPYFVCHGAITVLFLASLGSMLALNGYTSALDKEADKLKGLNAGLSRVSHSTRDASLFLGQLPAAVPSDLGTEPPAHFLHVGLDRAKSAIRNGQLTANKIEERDDEAVMPVSIAGGIVDYQSFVTALSRLEGMQFPFFRTKGLILRMNRDARDNTSLSYEITGDLTTLRAVQQNDSPPKRKAANTP